VPVAIGTCAVAADDDPSGSGRWRADVAPGNLTPRAGWNDGPSLRNLSGIPLLAAGVGTIVWSAASHATEWRASVIWRRIRRDLGVCAARSGFRLPDLGVEDLRLWSRRGAGRTVEKAPAEAGPQTSPSVTDLPSVGVI
jgi:hypothetical protein